TLFGKAVLDWSLTVLPTRVPVGTATSWWKGIVSWALILRFKTGAGGRTASKMSWSSQILPGVLTVLLQDMDGAPMWFFWRIPHSQPMTVTLPRLTAYS